MAGSSLVNFIVNAAFILILLTDCCLPAPVTVIECEIEYGGHCVRNVERCPANMAPHPGVCDTGQICCSHVTQRHENTANTTKPRSDCDADADKRCIAHAHRCPAHTRKSSRRCHVGELCCQNAAEYSTSNVTEHWDESCGVRVVATPYGERKSQSQIVATPYGERRSQSQIVGGDMVLEGDIPWQVSILVEGSHTCGGALISDAWVLTAAHCVIEDTLNYAVVLGEHDRSSTSPNQLTLSISTADILVHPGYDPTLRANDIALLRLPLPVVYTNYVRSICRPSTEANFLYMSCTVSGWGATYLTGTKTYVLRAAGVEVLENDACREIHDDNADLITSANICAGGLGKDACQGDSGGPLTCEIGGRAYLAGLVSWGRLCGEEGHPTVYTKIQHYLSWIDAHVTTRGRSRD